MRANPWVIGVAGVLALACAGAQGTDPKEGSGTPEDAGTFEDAGPGALPPELVTIGFSGEVVTVSGTPFVWTSAIRTAKVTGSFTYDRNAVRKDKVLTDSRTVFALGANGRFSLALGGHELSSSSGPFVEITGNTFRFIDGTESKNLLDPGEPLRLMRFDGVDTPAAGLWTSFVADHAIGTDLPAGNSFWFLDLAAKNYPHTFSITDGAFPQTRGTLLIQLDELHVVSGA